MVWDTLLNFTLRRWIKQLFFRYYGDEFGYDISDKYAYILSSHQTDLICFLNINLKRKYCLWKLTHLKCKNNECGSETNNESLCFVLKLSSKIIFFHIIFTCIFKVCVILLQISINLTFLLQENGFFLIKQFLLPHNEII